MADSKKTDEGGFAFPTSALFTPDGKFLSGGSDGMSIRDWFAGQALAGEFAAQNEMTGEITNNTSDEWMLDRAKTLYRMADAMIAARKGGA